MMRFIKVGHPSHPIAPVYYYLHQFSDEEGLVCVLSDAADCHVATWHSTGPVDAIYRAKQSARTNFADKIRRDLEAEEISGAQYRLAIGEEHGS